MRKQLDLFLDYGIKPGPVRIWFDARVQPFEDYVGNTYEYSIKVRYKPSSKRFPKEYSGARPSERKAMRTVESNMRAILGGMRFCMTDLELAALKSGKPGYYMQARTVYYSVALNGLEIVSRSEFSPGKRILTY